MKTPPTIISTLLAVALIGCGTTGPTMTPSTSPVASAGGGLGPTALLAMAVGGAGAGYIGNELSGGDPAITAAAAVGGTAAGGAIAYAMDKNKRRELAEAYEAGKRAARVEVLEQYWYDQTTSYRPGSGTSPTGEYRDIRYEGMVREGIRYDSFPQQVEIAEPIR